jgi:hypothetical protein
MIANGTIDELRFVGITSESISNGVNGLVTEFGYIRNIDTSGAPYGQTWTVGDIIYVSPTTAGQLTNVIPVAPNVKIVVANVINADNNFGVLLVRSTAYPQIENLSNVNISTVTGGDLLVYDGTDARWENAAQSTITAGKATNIAGGATGSLPYQSAADTTTFLPAGTDGQVLKLASGVPSWSSDTSGVTITDDTTTNATRYITFSELTAGNETTLDVSSTKLQFNPSTGVLTATGFAGAGTGLTGTASSLSIGGNAATATSATNVSGTVAIANGGTGETTRQAAIDALAGAVTSGQYLRGNGTDVVMSAIQAADVPTLNQNTTGTAANVTGTVAIANGGTGQTTAANAFNALSPLTTLGDILYEETGAVAARLPIGTTGQVLTVSGGKPAWGTAASSNITAQGLYENSATISANYTIGSGNNAMSAGPITVASGVTVTVPTGSVWTVV